jgi:hypothetical protein
MLESSESERSLSEELKEGSRKDKDKGKGKTNQGLSTLLVVSYSYEPQTSHEDRGLLPPLVNMQV